MKTPVPLLLLILLPLLCQGLENIESPICDRGLQQKYCTAWYGGDVHTGCKYCGIGEFHRYLRNYKWVFTGILLHFEPFASNHALLGIFRDVEICFLIKRYC